MDVEKMFRHKLLACVALVCLNLAPFHAANAAGKIVDTHRGVDVYASGRGAYYSSGKSFSDDRYYYGQKWQCVEFIKRFYHVALSHKMPNVWGHAQDYFVKRLPQGALNRSRGLEQYHNGNDMPPRVDDIIVWNRGKYGHVAIVSAVYADAIEIVQQNTSKRSREILRLTQRDGNFYLIGKGRRKKPMGWLRLPDNNAWPGEDVTTVASVLGVNGL